MLRGEWVWARVDWGEGRHGKLWWKLGEEKQHARALFEEWRLCCDFLLFGVRCCEEYGTTSLPSLRLSVASLILANQIHMLLPHRSAHPITPSTVPNTLVPKRCTPSHFMSATRYVLHASMPHAYISHSISSPHSGHLLLALGILLVPLAALQHLQMSRFLSEQLLRLSD